MQTMNNIFSGVSSYSKLIVVAVHNNYALYIYTLKILQSRKSGTICSEILFYQRIFSPVCS